MKRTNSSFVLIKSGFFRDKQTKTLYEVNGGFYPIDECVTQINKEGDKRLIIPNSACVQIPRRENISVLKY